MSTALLAHEPGQEVHEDHDDTAVCHEQVFRLA